MLQIKSVQSEHEFMMLLLFSEFVEDNTVVKGDHASYAKKRSPMVTLDGI